MKRWLPHPWIALGLFVAWLLLQRSVATTTIGSGVVLAVGLSWILVRFELPRVRVRRPWTLLPLAVRVFADIVRSNLAVARIILSPRIQTHPGFVTIPLELTSPYGLALLACIITATPGTIWVDHDPGRQTLVIHVLDVIDEATWIDAIKRRYERPLLRIFR